jgi:CysZ protein
MLAELPRVFAQLPDRRFVAVFLKSIALTLLVLAGVWYGLDSWLSGSSAPPLPLWMQRYWADAADWAALPVVIIAGWFLFPGIATGVMGLLLDGVVDAVEDRHYPHAMAHRRVPMAEAGLLALASALRVVLWNLALAPVYVLLLFTAVGPLILFTAVNGWLMGRDLLEMVAVRHMLRAEASALIASNRALRLRLGFTAAPLFLVPVLNLFAPIIAAALAAHAFQIIGKR